MTGDREWVEFQSRDDLRSWLLANYSREIGVWAVYPKPSAGLSDLSWDALVEECLCFGWIDSLPGKGDTQLTRTYISPRKPGSGWSRRNQNLVVELNRKGLMHEAGAAVVAAAKVDGSWSLFDLAEDLVVPRELQDGLAASADARAGFDAYSERTRKSLLQWYYSARTDATRTKRVSAIVDAASKRLKPKGF